MAFGLVSSVLSQTTNTEKFLNNKTTALVSPKTSPGISGFVFDIPENESVALSADITDNYTEDNSFINDHRVIKPVKITLTGLIGELVDKRTFADDVLSTVSGTLTTIDAYGGSYTQDGVQAIGLVLSVTERAVSRINQLVDRAKNIIEGFSGEGAYQNRQQRAFTDLKALINSETVLTVQTPWEYYDSMLIESIGFSQSGDSESYSDISVTLKEVRFAQLETTEYKEDLFASRNTQQRSDKADTGLKRGVRNSFLFDGATAATGAF